MEWIDFDRRGMARAVQTLERMHHPGSPESARPVEPVRSLPAPPAEQLSLALGQCARALSEASLTGSAPLA
jgi:hypothetical protein